MKKNKSKDSLRTLITPDDRPLFSWSDPEFQATPPTARERRGVKRLQQACPGKIARFWGEDLVTAPPHTISYDSDDVTIVRNKSSIERCVYCTTCGHEVVISYEAK